MVTALGVRHMDTHGVVKTQTAPHMQALVGHPSLATGSDEAVPVEGLLSLRPHNTLRVIVTYRVPVPLKMNSWKRLSTSPFERDFCIVSGVLAKLSDSEKDTTKVN